MFEAGAGPGSAGVLESASAGVASGGTAAFVVTLALRDVLVFEEEVEDVVDSVAGAPSEVAVVLEVALLLAAAVAFALEVEVEVVEAVESATDPLSGADAFFDPADFFAQVVFLVAVVFCGGWCLLGSPLGGCRLRRRLGSPLLRRPLLARDRLLWGHSERCSVKTKGSVLQEESDRSELEEDRGGLYDGGRGSEG